MKIVCISDTHCQLEAVDLPEGDLLIHSGDATYRGTVKEIVDFNASLGKIKHKYKHGIIFCPGNHDWLYETNSTLAKELTTNATVLINESITVDGFKIYGSPFTPFFHAWAFNLYRGKDLAGNWSKVPDDTNILVTHGPAYGILDALEDGGNVGCQDLSDRIRSLSQLKLHISGHIHFSHSSIIKDGVVYVNASICDERYNPTNKSIVIDL